MIAARAAGASSRAARRRWLVGALAVLLGACADPAAHVAAPAADSGRVFTGRFSLSVQSAQPLPQNGPTAWAGRFTLALAARSLTLDLMSPLGSTLARFESAPGNARLLVPADGGLRVTRGSDADALAQEVLGWSLPLAALADWIEGHPAPTRPFRALEAGAGGDRFEQDGWSVTVDSAAGTPGARRLRMERPGDGTVPAMTLKVVLDEAGSS